MKAIASLWSDEGASLYAQRKVEPKSVFGHIKGNRALHRFSLRGLPKVNIEFGLFAIAHKFLKQVAKDCLFQERILTNKKRDEKSSIFHHVFSFKGAFGTASFI